jgi:hypothetical protein
LQKKEVNKYFAALLPSTSSGNAFDKLKERTVAEPVEATFYFFP